MVKCQKSPKLLIFTTKNDTKYLQKTRDELMCFIPNSSYVSIRCFYSEANQFRRMYVTSSHWLRCHREKKKHVKKKRERQTNSVMAIVIKCFIFILFSVRFSYFFRFATLCLCFSCYRKYLSCSCVHISWAHIIMHSHMHAVFIFDTSSQLKHNHIGIHSNTTELFLASASFLCPFFSYWNWNQYWNPTKMWESQTKSAT